MVWPGQSCCTSALTVSLALAETGWPAGPEPVAEAVSAKEPAPLKSSRVMVWVPVHVMTAPGARLATGVGQVKASRGGSSVTATLDKVTLPVFVAVRV